MSTMAPSRFRFRVDLMPNEVVLFEGGAERDTITVLTLRALAFALTVVLVLTLPFVLATAANPSPDADTAAAAATLDDPAQRDRFVREALEAEAARTEAAGSTLRFAAGFVALIGLAGWLYGRLAWRNAWYVVTTERVCIQSGVLRMHLITIDLDKIVAVDASAGWIDERFGLHSIELQHPGVTVLGNGRVTRSPYVIAGVSVRSNVLTQLVSEWLPRDGRRKPAAA